LLLDIDKLLIFDIIILSIYQSQSFSLAKGGGGCRNHRNRQGWMEKDLQSV